MFRGEEVVLTAQNNRAVRYGKLFLASFQAKALSMSPWEVKTTRKQSICSRTINYVCYIQASISDGFIWPLIHPCLKVTFNRFLRFRQHSMPTADILVSSACYRMILPVWGNFRLSNQQTGQCRELFKEQKQNMH